MVDIHVSYEGRLRCSARHGPSGARLETDAPVDNQGLGQAFSPTDLVATGLGSCMLTLMGITARKHGWVVDGITVRVVKEMTQLPPRRIQRLAVEFDVPEAVRRTRRKSQKRARAGSPWLPGATQHPGGHRRSGELQLVAVTVALNAASD
jgi:putative redox protein